MFGDKKCDYNSISSSSNVDGKRLSSFTFKNNNNSGKVSNSNRQNNNQAACLPLNDDDDRKFNQKKNLINKKLYSLRDFYRNESIHQMSHLTNDTNTSQSDLKNHFSVNNNKTDNSSHANISLNQSETTSITLSVSCTNSNDDDDDDDDENTNDNEEFQAIFKRISINLNDRHVNLAPSKKSFNNNEATTTTTTTTNNANISTNSTILNSYHISISTLKNLFKLLKLYKLEHYMNDLIDAGYSSTISLHKLKKNDLDQLNVSPYDKKKFLKLQLFIKQVMNTINLSQTKTKTKTMNTHGRRSSSCSMPPTASNNNITNNNNADSTALMENKIKKMITIKKAQTSMTSAKRKSFTPKQEAEPALNLARNFSGTMLNQKDTNTPNWQKEPSSVATTKPPQPIVISKLFTKNPNLPAQQTTNRIKRVVKTSSAPNKQNRFSLVQRAKSSEPSIKKSPSTNLVSSIASKSTTLIDINSVAASVTGGVNHPAQMSRTGKKQNDEYFGPKLSVPQLNEIQNIQLVKTNNYNYGVPQVQPTIVNKKLKKSKSNHLLNQEPGQSNNIVTNDIYVYARKRPKLPCENKYQDVILVNENSDKSKSKFSTICVNESKQAVDGTPVLRKSEFQFDKTFDANQTNEDIFKSSIEPFIGQPAENRNDFACICFGQTGSGKTHTLFGNSNKTSPQDGLCVLTAQSLFQSNERLICGFYEIYNGQLYDLLNQKNRLVLREDSNGQVNVVGLVEIEIKTLNHLRKTIETAQASRHVGSTSFNKASSRSHAVIQFKVPNVSSQPASAGHIVMNKAALFNSKTKKTSQPKPFRVLFIDLAGSERGIDAQTNQQDNRKEGAEINQSLLALKECIRCIDQLCSYAPFRQSKLTRVLRDCFIGLGRTILIATVSPTDDCVSCSINTLQYANRVRQMTLRNRVRNEKLLTEQTKELAAAATCVSTARSEKKSSNSSSIKTRASSANPPPSTSNSKESNKKRKPKVYKDIFNDEEIKNQNNFVSSSPISNRMLNAMQETSIHSKTNPTTSNQKPTKPLGTAAFSSMHPFLFHPSKINMSSTPIKNPADRLPLNSDDLLLFENDTPIKGHKLKYMANSQPIVRLAERYFARVLPPEQSLQVASNVEPAKNMNEPLTKDLNNKIKNEDIESGVESEELNKSIEHKQQISTSKTTKLNHPNASFTTTSSSKYNQSSNLEDSLSRLRKKQKELIESKKYLNAINFEETTEETADESTGLSKQNRLEDELRSIEPAADTADSNLNKKQDQPAISQDQKIQQQTQLKTYIQNLEYKLNNLRNEMNENQEIRKEKVNIKHRERSLSTDSCDSLKEIKKSNAQSQLRQEFIQQQKKLSSLNSDTDEKRKSFPITNDKTFGEDHEELFFKLQKEQNQETSPKDSSNLLFENSIGSSSSDDNNNNIELKSLKKSMHKGASSTAFLLSKMKKSFATSSPASKSDQQIFSPIIKVESINYLDTKSGSKSFDNDLTPRNHCQLLNPIPIRLSASSSFDSTQINDENNPSNSSHLSFNNNDILTPSKLKITNSKIWKSTSSASPIQSNEKKTWSSLLAAASAASSNSNDKQAMQANALKIQLQPNNESLMSNFSEIDANSRLLPLSSNDFNKFKKKDLLIVAHENQLSNITEACKKEMNLLTCLRDSQMEFDEYLIQVEEMLSQKAHSIRDLQYQITQLKHLKNPTNEQII